MPSNHTEHYSLSQWERTDKVRMEDFNADNAKIDAALAEKAAASVVTALQAAVAKKAEQSDLTALQTTVNGKASQSALNALQTTVAGKGNCRIELSSYVGTGASPMTIKTSFPPKVMFILSGRLGVGVRGYTTFHYIGDNVRAATVVWQNDGITLTRGTVANDGQWNNLEGTTYYYAVLG